METIDEESEAINRSRADADVGSGSIKKLFVVDWICHKFAMLSGVGERHWLRLEKCPESGFEGHRRWGE
jgi:hypothetical protein